MTCPNWKKYAIYVYLGTLYFCTCWFVQYDIYLFHLANQVKYMFPLEESVVATLSTNKGIYDKVIQNIAKSSWLETVAPEPKPV